MASQFATSPSASASASASSGSVRYPERQSAPGSAARNVAGIVQGLTPLFSSLASAASSSRTPGVLELASGQGTHVSALARAFSTLRFSPCEADASLCSLINDACSGLSNVAEARVLEIEQGEHWAALQAREEDGFEAVLALNLVHIIPAPLVRTLFERVAEVLKPGGTLVLYGAYNENGKVTSEGNAAFDANLRTRNPEFGLRDLQRELEPLAQQHGMRLKERIEMPAGNLLVLFERNEKGRNA